MESTILSAIQQICEEKNLSPEQVLEAIEQALAAAFRKDFGEKNQNIKVKFNPENKGMKVFDIKTVVEDVLDEEETEEETENNDKEEKQEKKRFNPRTEIQISEAKLLRPNNKKIAKNKVKIDHSGLHVFGFIPTYLKCSSGILASLSLISVGNILFFPIMNVLGFSILTFSCSTLQ